MVSLAVESRTEWFAPLPLWAQISGVGLLKNPGLNMSAPAIFRFDSDSFMAEFTAVISKNPRAIKDWIAQYETWREPMPSPRPVAPDPPPKRLDFLYARTKAGQSEKDFRAAMDSAATSAGRLKAVSEDDKKIALQARGSTAGEILKLYQPAQQRFYMVGASLVCDEPGYPDGSVDRIKGEKVSYVVRRLLPDSPDNDDVSSWGEYAFVEAANGWTWQQVAAHNDDGARVLAPGEEQYPLFPMIYRDHCQRDRKILGGIIPVGKRETWLGAGATGTGSSAAARPDVASPLERLFVNDVIEPWKNMIVHAQSMRQGLSSSGSTFPDVNDSNPKPEIFKTLYIEARDQIQTISWYVLLDFAKFLEKHLNNIWRRIAENDQTVELQQPELDLISALQGVSLRLDLRNSINAESELKVNRFITPRTMLDALVAIRGWENNLEAVDSAYNRNVSVDSRWPDFLFPLADPQYTGSLNYPAALSVSTAGLTEVGILHARLDKLLGLVRPLLASEAILGANDVLSQTPVVDKKEAYFVIRCVYQRPLCGPLFPELLSQPSRLFHVASFFDPDAPARPIRIPMPMDISPAGLRKYQKNTGFIISDMLCGKLKQVRGLTFADLVLSVLPWPFHKGLPEPAEPGPCKGPGGGFGMICSLSIPIVTLCALLLLMIIVALFDIFFRWLPLLFVCLPIPGLSGKK